MMAKFMKFKSPKGIVLLANIGYYKLKFNVK